jgi:hypothetical protein
MVSNEMIWDLTLTHYGCLGKKVERYSVKNPDSLDTAQSIKQSYYHSAPIPFPIIGGEYGKTVR